MHQIPEEQKDKRRWTKYLAWTLAAFTLSIFIIALIAHLWVIPAKVTREIERALSKFWDGRVAVRGIDVNYFGPIYIAKINFSDKTGRRYISAGKVNMTFENWPGPHPVVTVIEMEKLGIQLSKADGKVTLPVKRPQKNTPGKKKKIDIRKLSINDIEITFTDAQNTKYLYDNIRLLAEKNNNFYNFSLNQNSTESPESLLANGKINFNTFETNSSLQIKHTIQEPEMALVFSALNIPNLSAEGRLEADLKITGSLKQPAQLKPHGSISFDEWTVAKNSKIIAADLTTKADIENGYFNFKNITATVCEGDAAGSFYVKTEQDKTAEFSGRLLAENMSFVELTSILGEKDKKATKGTVTFGYAFSGQGRNLQNLTGEGQIFLDDADISTLPILPYIFNTAGLSEIEPLKVSDAECDFTTAGPLVTIQTANVANRFAAVRAEPGGTVNLKTKQIDMHVKAVLIKQIDDIIKKIPVINIINNLKDRLTRLRIEGNWSEPPSKIIKKEPITDIKDATVGFFQDIVKSGGQLTRKVRGAAD